jgi:hypothetical protein
MRRADVKRRLRHDVPAPAVGPVARYKLDHVARSFPGGVRVRHRLEEDDFVRALN